MANRKPTFTVFVLTIAVCMPVFLFFASICLCRAHDDSRCGDHACCCETMPGSESRHATCGCVMCSADPMPLIPPPQILTLHLVRTAELMPDMIIPPLSAFKPLILRSGAPPPDTLESDRSCAVARSVVLRI